MAVVLVLQACCGKTEVDDALVGSERSVSLDEVRVFEEATLPVEVAFPCLIDHADSEACPVAVVVEGFFEVCFRDD
jgi:hypothetical protein